MNLNAKFIPGFIDYQHATVSVSNVNEALAFYRDLLGFPVLGRLYYRNEVRLVIDFLDMGNGAILEIFSFAVPTKPTEWIPDDLQLGMRHMAFKVKDVDATTARLKKAGVEFTLDPLDATGGVRIAFFKAPGNALLEIMHGELDYHRKFQDPLPVAPPQGAPSRRELTFEHVAMTVKDIDKSLEFYNGILGFPVLGQLDLGGERGFLITYLQAGNFVLELFSFSVPTIYATWNPDETVLGLKHQGFLVHDVDAVAKRLVEKGVRIIYPPNSALGDVKTCFFADPDGNALELIDGTCTYDE